MKVRKKTVVVIICVVMFAGCWFSGLAGRLVGCLILPLLLPLRVNKAIEISALTRDKPPAIHEKGLVLTIGSDRLRKIMHGAFCISRLFPPGLIRDGMVLKGSWMPDKFRLPEGNRLPFMIVIDDDTRHPGLVFRYPAAAVNELMKDEIAEALRSEEEYILGTYNIIYYITFQTLRIYSEEQDLDTAIQARLLICDATGKVRFKFEENLLDLRATGRVKKLRGRFDIRVIRDDEGIGFSYKVKIEELDIDVHNLANWGDRRVSKKLRRSWEKSLNKEKKQKRLAKVRLPEWVPLDLVVDFQLTP